MKYFDYQNGKNILKFAYGEEKGVYLLYAGAQTDYRVNETDATFQHLTEVQLSGVNHLEHHFSKHYRSSETLLFQYVEHFTRPFEKGEELVIVSKSDRVQANNVFRFYNGVKGFRTYTEIISLIDSVVLDYVSAFSYVGIDGVHNGSWQDCTYVYIPHNYWKAECSWHRYSVKELGLFDCSDFSAKRISLSNVGTWSTKEHLPMGIFENTQTGDFLLWEIEGSLAWNWEISNINNRLYLLAGGGSLQESFWQKQLAKGQTYTTPEVYVTYEKDIERLFTEVTAYRRASREYNDKVFSLAPVFNDYMNCLDTKPTTELELPLIDIASQLGCKYYMIDAGWYTDGHWWDYTGEWLKPKTRFNGGLEYVTDYIKQKGMIPGLWVEIEVMSVGLPFAENLPDEWFFRRNGKRVIDNSRYMLDFSNKEVRKFADQALDRIITEYGAGYVKMDHNINAGVGTESATTWGDGLERHWQGFMEWITGVMERHPEVIFESCASGGCRMEYGLLRKYHLQSTSDQTVYTNYASISANSITAVTPEQAGVWTYPIVGNDAEAVAYNMVNAMLVHVYQSGRVDLISKDLLALVKEGIDTNQAIKEVILNGTPVWPLGLAGFADSYITYGLKYGNVCYLSFWNKENTDTAIIPLEKYGVVNVEQVYPKNLNTDYDFNGKTLKIKPHQTNFARLFKLTIK